VIIHKVSAHATVLARLGFAIVDVDFAVDSTPSGGASASVLVDTIFADTVVEARVQLLFSNFTLVDVDFAVLSCESRLALAGTAVDAISALTTVLARLQSTLINVDFAIFSFESSWAIASVIVDEVSADTTVLARFWLALVDVDFAIFSFISSRARALVVVDKISANTSVLALSVGSLKHSEARWQGHASHHASHAWCSHDQHWQCFCASVKGAIVDVDLAIFACIPWRACAGVITRSIGTGSSVLAWLWFALVNIDFAIVPQKTSRAFASVAVKINWVLDTFSPPSFCLLVVLARV
jgi:hypothetical protein